MQIFCECNSTWTIETETKVRRQQIIHEEDDHCPICGYFCWHDADYENMMVDLRIMNN